MKKAFSIPLFLLYLFFSLSNHLYAATLFNDNFDDNDISDWTVVQNKQYDNPNSPCLLNGSPSNWVTYNGRAGIKINNSPSCIAEITPNSLSLNGILKYSYSLDMEFTGTVSSDRHIAFKYKDPSYWYNFKFYGNEIIFQKVVGQYYYFTKFSPYPFVDNGIYHFKIDVEANSIKLFINDQLVWEIPDYSPSFPNDTIALQGSVGANPSTEVWFDNLEVTSPEPSPTPTPSPLTPVVFVPGLGGSINFKEMFLGENDPLGWKMTLGANVYKNIFKAFEGNNDFFVFYYDWRKPVLDGAQKLNSFIQNEVKPWNNKVNIIGHSLGGLVGRACVQKTTDNCFAEKLIAVGSPHLGVVEAYPLVEAGEIYKKGLLKLFFELLLHYFQIPGETRRQTLERIAPVIKELLPNFDYIYKNGSLISFADLSVQNPLLGLLTDLLPLENITSILAGNSFSTLRYLTVANPNWLDQLLGNWPDGKPTSQETNTEGDNTILLLSSTLNNPQIQNFSYNLNHGGIISEQQALEKIFEIIGYDLPVNSYPPLNEEENYLVFFVHSPVKISSPDITENDYASDELIIISDPADKNYSLVIEGQENNYYSLSVGQIFGDWVIWNDYFGKAQPNLSENYLFAINPANPSEYPFIDTDGTKTNELLNYRLEEFEKEIIELNLKKIHREKLLALLRGIKKSKKNPELSLNQLLALRKIVANFETNKIISHQIAATFRKKSSEIAGYLEYLLFLNPKAFGKNEAFAYLKRVESIEKKLANNKLSPYSGLVVLEGKEKLQNARERFKSLKFFQTFIFCRETEELFLEAKKIN